MKNIKVYLMLLTVLSLSFMARGQDSTGDEQLYGNGTAFARIAVSEGTVTVNRDGAGEMDAVQNFTIEPLDILTTSSDGRTVVQLIDGTLLKLDNNTKVEFLEIASAENDGNISLLARLWQGTVLLDVSDDADFSKRSYRFDTVDSSMFFLTNGKYRVDKTDGDTALKVVSGSAEMSVNDGSKLLHSGEMGRASQAYAGISTSFFNTFNLDNFDLWAMNRYRRQTSASVQYVPSDIKHYVSELDSYGTWYYDTGLSTYVWHPSIVDVSWTPYSHGYWSWSPYGMSWVSSYPWGYAPFHYGCWDFSVSFGWVWVPGRYYSPAWVSWSYWDGYVGWHPYNRHYYNRYHRGRVVRSHPRQRVVYTSVNSLTRRHQRLDVRDLPDNGRVTRVTRPIVPNLARLNSNPREAVRSAITRPVTRKAINERTTVIRQRNSSESAVRYQNLAESSRYRKLDSRREPNARGPVVREQRIINRSQPGSSTTPSQQRIINRNQPVPRKPSQPRTPTVVRPETNKTITIRESTTRKPVVRSERKIYPGNNSSPVIKRSQPATTPPKTTRNPSVSLNRNTIYSRPQVPTSGYSRPSVTVPRTAVLPTRNSTVRSYPIRRSTPAPQIRQTTRSTPKVSRSTSARSTSRSVKTTHTSTHNRK